MVVVKYNNSGYLSFALMTLNEFKEEENGNYSEHEPCSLSSIEELESFYNSLSPDSSDIEYYSNMIEEYYRNEK